MTETLPQGWAEPELQELCWFNPKHPPNTDRSIEVSFVPMPAVSDLEGIILTHSCKTLDEVWKGYTHFADNDVIFAKITPCMENGKIAVARNLKNGLACGSTEFHVLRSKGAVIPDYLYRFLRQESYRQDAEQVMTGAVGQRRVPASFLKETKFPLPPLAEQKRIVAKLEALLTRSTNARNELARIPRLIERYKQAVLAAAFRGDLTADWREENPNEQDLSTIIEALCATKGIKRRKPLAASWHPELTLPDRWVWVSVDQMAPLVQYGSSAKASEELTDGVPVLRMGNIVNGRISYSKLKFLPSNHPEFPSLLLEDGDVLFNRTNSADLVGKTAVYRAEKAPASFASYLIRLQVCGYIPELLSAYINSSFGREWVASVVSQQVGQANVNGTKLRELAVPYPPPKEQKILWERINKAFAAIDIIEAELIKAEALRTRLEQATLAKAFRGELVPQNPNDEPASVLLERIRAELASKESGRKGRKRQND